MTNIFPLCPDADKQPADSLSRVAAFNVEELLLKSSETSKGAFLNNHESLPKSRDLNHLVPYLMIIYKNL